MAKNQEIMEINLRKNTNASSKGYGKYYGLVEFNGTLTTRALAEHMACKFSWFAFYLYICSKLFVNESRHGL